MHRLVWLCCGLACWAAAAVEAAPQQEASEQAARRVASLEQHLEAFQLRLVYYGEQGKPFYNLTLSVAPVAPLEDNPFHPAVQIDNEQAKRILRRLDKDGFFERAAALGEESKRPAAPSGYFLSVTGKDSAWQEDLGWNLAMLERLDNLQAVLDGKAAESMKLLRGRLSGYRRIWEAEKQAKAPGDAQ